MSDISEKTSSFVDDLGDAARRNPLSTALIGMGIVWLFSGRAAEVGVDAFRRSGLDRFPDAAGNAIDTAGSAVQSTVRSLGDAVGSAAERAQGRVIAAFDDATRIGKQQFGSLSEYAGSLPDAGSDVLSDVRDNISEMLRVQPLAIGAIGLAIGAVIAAALPTTAIETEYLGESSDLVKEKAQAFASEQTSRVAAAAESVIGAAENEAREQGLTMEGAKSVAGDMSAKIGRVVDAAGKVVTGKANSPLPSPSPSFR